MSKMLWLQKQQGEARIKLKEPADLFDSEAIKAFLGRQEAEHSAFAAADTPALASCNSEAAESGEPVVLLQEAAMDYCLERAAINAGLLRFEQMTQEHKRQCWKAARLRIDEQLSDERLYLVYCIDHSLLCWGRVNAKLEPLGVTYIAQRDAQGMLEHDERELSEVTLRAVEIASTRALYALWLDVGSVLVAVSGTGSIAIRDAWSIEQQQVSLEREAMNEALQRWLEGWEMDVERKFWLGADPELVFVDESNKLVSASSVLLDHVNEEIGIDSLLYKRKLIYPIVELRPRPASHPARLTASLHRLLKELQLLVADERPLRWLAGGMPVKGVALGGHLHVSGILLTPRLLRLLDAMLALPFAALADEAGYSRNDKYGGMGDYRKQFHGGFEYRTLPSWLVSPALARAAIYCFWVTVQQRFALAERLNMQELQAAEEAYVLGDRKRLYTAAERNIELLLSLTDDDRAREAVKPLQRALKQRGTWNEQTDIKARWKLVDKGLKREETGNS